MKTLVKNTNQNFPLKWVNLDSYTESNGYKIEIYLVQNDNLVERLVLMFYSLFRSIKNKIKIYSPSWWDYCLDTWDSKNDKYHYELETYSVETKDYLKMLKESSIEIGYSGVCECYDWDRFLTISLSCIISYTAPYSPVFYNEEDDFFFYFHHTGSIGLYYKVENDRIREILDIVEREFELILPDSRNF